MFNLMLHHHSQDCIHGCALNSEGSQFSEQKVRILGTALVLVLCFAGSELAIGYFCHSVALQAESGHMISDSFALSLSMVASWIAQRQSKDRANLGDRVEVLAALFNSIGLVAIAIWIGIEAIASLQSPPADILSLPMLITAGIGLGVNGVNVVLLHDSSHHDLNMRGAFLHVIADLISSVGVILAAIAVWLMHWLWADSIISLFVSALIILSAIPLIVQSLNLLGKKPPSNLNIM
ncbi:cation diffusion facilitator family transporter [Fischerella sp.]|uniref:cation diffusion facilitator family transporter n=1 Tax=Fischerella sp. TaxID=1191 RepID=UPI0025BDBFAD|nr:cation diffusion facilitator family transporter [Fischerella sp.]